MGIVFFHVLVSKHETILKNVKQNLYLTFHAQFHVFNMKMYTISRFFILLKNDVKMSETSKKFRLASLAGTGLMTSLREIPSNWSPTFYPNPLINRCITVSSFCLLGFGNENTKSHF